MNSIKRSLSGGSVSHRSFVYQLFVNCFLSEPGIYHIIIDGTKGITYAKIELEFIFSGNPFLSEEYLLHRGFLPGQVKLVANNTVIASQIE